MTTRALQITELLTPVIDPDTGAVADGYTAYFYSAGTSNAKNVWTEKEKTNPYTSVVLGSGSFESGTAQVYGDGIYKITIKDADAATVLEWDDVKVYASNFSVVTKTGAYTATPDDDIILVDTDGGNVTISLEAVANFTHPIEVKNIGSNNVTIDPDGAETIDGDSTVTLLVENEAIVITPDTNGSQWRRTLQAASSVRLVNDTYMLSTDNAGTGTVNIIKAGTDDVVAIGVGSYKAVMPSNGFGANGVVMCGDSDTIAWFYLNTAPPGWKATATGADMVLGVAGGSEAYNVNGGNPDSVATWEISDMNTDAHNHQWHDSKSGNDESYDINGDNLDYQTTSLTNQGIQGNTGTAEILDRDYFTKDDTHSHTFGGAWRPKASVGKLFQLDTA